MVVDDDDVPGSVGGSSDEVESIPALHPFIALSLSLSLSLSHTHTQT
jgi:hypothetical protein